MNNKKDLFICLTPLQVVVAKAIILSKDYTGSKPDFVLFTLSASSRYNYYFNDMKDICSETLLYPGEEAFPFYVHRLREKFKGKQYRHIYFASISFAKIQYILSFSEFQKIRTFDDGTANISRASKYYVEKKGLFAKLIYITKLLFGNKYSIQRIKSESELHYTLYPTKKNIIDRLRPVNLLPYVDGKEPSSNETAIVFLGTVFDEVVVSADKKKDLINRASRFLANKGEVTCYVPHPRDEKDYFPSLKKDDSSLIAEEVIINLLDGFSRVVVIGFGSSAQFNLMGQERVENIVLSSTLMKREIKTLGEMMPPSNTEIVSID